MKIKQIINQPVTSNCFIVFHENNNSCIVIDPGSENSCNIENAINEREVDYIFLTHEHFDHIWCTDKIREKYNAKLCCSADVAKSITNKKKNLSLFVDQIGFELNIPDVILDHKQHINWYGTLIEIIHTPGHTEGSICIKINDNLFTGDTIIKDTQTVTKLPSGNKDKLQNSIEKLAQMGLSDFNLYCGHGENDIKHI